MKSYRITYAISREDENIYTAIVDAMDMNDAIAKAREYIDIEHGFLTTGTIVGLSILELD